MVEGDSAGDRIDAYDVGLEDCKRQVLLGANFLAVSFDVNVNEHEAITHFGNSKNSKPFGWIVNLEIDSKNPTRLV